MNNPFFQAVDKPEYMGAAQQEALSRMNHVVETKSLGVLTGEVGSGKSTLLRTLAGMLGASDHQVIYLCSSRMSPKDLYASILRNMGEVPSFSTSKIKQQWHEIMEDRTRVQSRQLVVMIDEAHDMPNTTLLELRFLMTRGMEAQSPFPVILAGQAKLRRDLNTNLMEPISQRIRMQYHLSGMTVTECQQYVDQRMKSAGLERPVFTESAIKQIYSTTQGVPRLLNLLCGNSLILAAQKSDNAVEDRHVTAVLADLDRQRGNIN